MDEYVNKFIDELIASVTYDIENPRVVTDPGEAVPCVDPSEFIVVVELAQGGAVVHHPIMKTATTLNTLETLANNLMEYTRGAVKASVCRVVREKFTDDE